MADVEPTPPPKNSPGNDIPGPPIIPRNDSAARADWHSPGYIIGKLGMAICIGIGSGICTGTGIGTYSFPTAGFSAFTFVY